ncbi:MAG TPA: FAD-dependent oxidoreductase [Solirubrobacteraceae bacterium]|nr:FAD-dependent oxidoreductase [Solirubrobacteraceae bacterium]
MSGVVIVGGGLAGQRCAETLRRCGYEGSILIACGEPHLPYDRTPLSKELLLDAAVEEELSFRSPRWYEEKAVELRLGAAACHLNDDAASVHLSDGSSVSYEQLLIATGSRPRRPPMFEGYENVSTLRTREDACTLRRALVPGVRLLVIGAGFIGQEAASSATNAGARVTLVEAASTPLERVLGNEVGGWFAGLHRSNGVELLLEQRVVGVRGERRVDSVTLADGRTIDCDHVLIGAGVDPEVAWLSSSSLGASRVQTDVDGRTDIPGIYAAGDVAAAFDPRMDRHVAGDHWESAGRQGSRAAKAMLGMDPGPLGVSSFWSDLYGTRVQYLGNASLSDELTIDGDPRAREFTVTFTLEERPVAVLLVGRPNLLPQARQLLSAAKEVAYA